MPFTVFRFYAAGQYVMVGKVGAMDDAMALLDRYDSGYIQYRGMILHSKNPYTSKSI